MSRRPVMSATARVRAERRELRRLAVRASEVVKRHIREAVLEGLIAGRVEEDGTIVLVEPPAPSRMT